MKAKFLYIVLCLYALAFSACVKHDYAVGIPSPIMALSDLRAMYKGADLPLNRDLMFGAYQIAGTVISNPDSGNVQPKVVILQNHARGFGGITLPLGANAASYKAGDSLVVTVEGKTLQKVNGAMQINVTEANVRKVSSGNKVDVQSVSSLNIKKNPFLYENTLVQIKTATVSPAPKPTDIYAGDRYLVNGADSIQMHTEATANYANQALPASATVTGILIVGQNTDGSQLLQVWPRTGADFTDKTKPVDPSGPGLGANAVIITGYVNDAKGADGNYEYFQFRATRDIDFTKNPMAVVTCTNAGTAAPDAGDAPVGGWAEGGGRSYKFNLTTGSVKKGEFFYVGGSAKKINGANTTDMSSSNWPRVITYTTNDGDGFGSASSGLLPNSGNAGGIAVFEGTNVVESSVPMDAILFGGTGKTTIYNATLNKGYRVPVSSDHYANVDGTSGAAQPFFFQGSNTYVIPHSTPADAGIFCKLGGVYDTTTKTWKTLRTYKFLTMTSSTPVTDIETGADVTAVQ